MLLVLSLAACQHIAYTMNERAWRDTGLLSSTAPDEMRQRFIKVVLKHTDPVMVEFDLNEMRALEMLLTDADPRDGKLPDGTPILTLLETVWRTRIEATNAAGNRDHDPHVLAYSDDREAAGGSDPIPIA